MNINGPKEAYQFLVGNGIVGICPESANFIVCMDILSRMCSCDPQPTKVARFNRCIQNYIGFVARAQGFASTILDKVKDSRVVFYLNGQQIGTICR